METTTISAEQIKAAMPNLGDVKLADGTELSSDKLAEEIAYVVSFIPMLCEKGPSSWTWAERSFLIDIAKWSAEEGTDPGWENLHYDLTKAYDVLNRVQTCSPEEAFEYITNLNNVLSDRSHMREVCIGAIINT